MERKKLLGIPIKPCEGWRSIGFNDNEDRRTVKIGSQHLDQTR